MAAKRNKSDARKQKKRKLKKGRVAIAVIVPLMLISLVVLSLTVFFPIREIQVKEKTRYTVEEIANACGISLGDNLFRVSESTVSKRLCRSLPYVKAVDLKRSLPGTVILNVTEQVPEYAFRVEEGFLIVGGGRALELVEEQPEALTLVEYAPDYEIGSPISLAQYDDKFARLTSAIAGSGLTDISCIRLEDTAKISLVYDDRITLELGSIDDVEKKLKKAVQILTAVDEDYNGHAEGTVRLQYEDSYFERGSPSSEPAAPETASEDENSSES